MLRKRTSFKPNLKQVTTPQQAPQKASPLTTPSQHQDQHQQQEQATPQQHSPQAQPPLLLAQQEEKQSQPEQQQQQQQQQQSQKPATPIVILPQDKHPEQYQQQPSQQEPSQQQSQQQQQQQTSNITNQSQPVSNAVQEAITQLTGQKFEPIKSLSLRSSANKNVKLKDLLFFNPPMTKDQKRHKKSIHLAKKNEKKRKHEEELAKQAGADEASGGGSNEGAEKTQNPATIDDVPPVADDEHSLVPKVKMGPEGKLILDESSTIINRKNAIKEQEAIIEDHEDVVSKTNYDSFRRKPTSTSQSKWSLEDTKKFYHALTILGTDFSMMESLLFSGYRSRTELHKKFKREERINKSKVDIALTNRISLNSEELDDLREIFYKV